MAGLPDPLAIIIVAAMPVLELRGAIPLGVLVYKMPTLTAAALSVLGNMLPVPVILYGATFVIGILKGRFRWLDTFIDKILERTHRKAEKSFERYRDLALVIFVAIPLPMTGAYSGALAAWLFGVPPRRAIPLVGLGVVIAAVVVSALVNAGMLVAG